jgi:1,4-dihydroxy-2-naphthoate octaprenyltransferase
VVARRLSFEALFASLPIAVFVMLILYVNQVPDRRGDEAAGKLTVAVRLSAAAITRGYDVFVALGFALVVFGVLGRVLPPAVLISLAAAPLAVRVHRGLVRHYDEPYMLMPALTANIALHLAVGIGVVAGYGIEILF